jgi:hypothetical protein
MKEREGLEGLGDRDLKRCQGCGKEGEGKIAKCKGCESVWYCNKVRTCMDLMWDAEANIG